MPETYTNSPHPMYATDQMLRIRREIHEQYSVPKVDFAAWALGCVEWRGDENVLDVGCGPGHYYQLLHEHLPGITYSGLDLYPGMIQSHPARERLIVGNAERLPYPDNTFDVVLANHMLFHVPDIEGAIREFHRVLKPDGILMATTNSITTMPEFQVLFRRAIVLLAAPGTTDIQPPVPVHGRFTLENGARMLARHFFAVVRHDLPGTLVFPSVEPVMEYLESGRAMQEAYLPEGVAWDDVMMIMREQISALVHHFGELVVTKLSGVLVASDRGGFIREFIEMREQSRAAL